MDLFNVTRGECPLLVSIPHAGTFIPGDIQARMTADACLLTDTDWHLPMLYDFLGELDVSVLAANYSRYVVDLNRSPRAERLYPGRFETGVCASETFEGLPLYVSGAGPTEDEVAARLDAYWRPYHERLKEDLSRIRGRHGYAILFDAHSIANVVPMLFEGVLPDLNVGTNSGRSCADSIADAVMAVAAGASGHSAVIDGRFKGGYITRYYGRPQESIHAIQLELSQDTYMNQNYPFDFIDSKAATIRPVLKRIVDALSAVEIGRA